MASVFSTPMNQKEIAEAAGVSESFVSHVAAGTKQMPLKMQFAIWGPAVELNGQPLTEWRTVFKDARIAQGMSELEVAQAAGYKGKISIMRLENSTTRTISIDKFRQLAGILNIKGIPTNEHHPVQDQPSTINNSGTTESESGRPPVRGADTQSTPVSGVGAAVRRSVDVRTGDDDVHEAAGSDTISPEG